MWDSSLSMRELNNSLADLKNMTCANETCSEPVQSFADLKWGLLSLLLLIFCTAGGNLLVCLAVCWDRRLQNMTNYFLMSLAIADLLVSLLVMPFGMIVEVHGYFPLQSEVCAFWVTMDVLMCTASIWHMCTMSMDRYFTLKYPMQYGRNKTKTMVVLKITFVWAVSIAISSPICIYGFVDRSVVFQDGLCVPTLKEFVIYGSVFAFYIPLTIMVLTYLLTTRILWHNQRLMRTIDRSDFRLRPRQRRKYGKSYHMATMLSPPSSDSRRESHTELSSLARTPNRERVNLPGNDTDCVTLEDLKPVIDTAYFNTMSTRIPQNTVNPEHSMLDEQSIGKSDCDMNSQASVEGLSEDYKMIPNTCTDSSELTPLTLHEETTKPLHVPKLTINSSNEINSSFGSLKFRSRTNTDVVYTSNFPTTYSSLKLPKNPQNLQASVSCSNFTRNGSDMGIYKTGNNSGGGLNRDYKSLEWSQHFHEIQKEMDQCIREARFEKKLKSKKAALIKELQSSDQSSNHSAVESDIRKDELKPDYKTGIISDSGDSMDDVDSSSENNSDLLTIKLYPKSVYMYKLEVPKDSSRSSNPSPKDSPQLPNGIRKHRFYRTVNSDSDKSSDTNNRIKPSRRSIKKFFKNIHRNKHGFKQLISSKTTSNEKKASKVLGIIFGVFVVLWTPFFTVNILSATCDACMRHVTPEMMSAFLWMGYVASLANPIIYTMFNTAFRRAFFRILSCHVCKHGTIMQHRGSIPSSYQASVYTDRRQTVTMLINNNAENRIPSDFGSNYSR